MFMSTEYFTRPKTFFSLIKLPTSICLFKTENKAPVVLTIEEVNKDFLLKWINLLSDNNLECEREIIVNKDNLLNKKIFCTSKYKMIPYVSTHKLLSNSINYEFKDNELLFGDNHQKARLNFLAACFFKKFKDQILDNEKVKMIFPNKFKKYNQNMTHDMLSLILNDNLLEEYRKWIYNLHFCRNEIIASEILFGFAYKNASEILSRYYCNYSYNGLVH